jgi:hypothetical protein
MDYAEEADQICINRLSHSNDKYLYKTSGRVDKTRIIP